MARKGIYKRGIHNNINDELVVKVSISCCLDEKKKNVVSWLESVMSTVEVRNSGDSRDRLIERDQRMVNARE